MHIQELPTVQVPVPKSGWDDWITLREFEPEEVTEADMLPPPPPPVWPRVWPGL